MKFDISQILKDPNGSPSSKRLVTIGASSLLLVSYVVSWFGVAIDHTLFSAIMYLCMAGTGFSALDHFAPFQEKPEGS